MAMTNKQDDIPAEIDFSTGQRGRFYRPQAQWHVPVYLNPDIQQYFLHRAKQRGIDFERLVNALLQKDMELLETLEPEAKS